MRLLLSVLIIATSSVCIAQDFGAITYTVDDGLPTDVIKGVTQDSLGFIWIASDEGIARFDGSRFETFKGTLRSQYAKAFQIDQFGRIYMIGDLDLILIENHFDTTIFESIKIGSRNPNDSTLWYPKSIHISSENEIWIGEPQSVVLLKNGILKRFDFGKEDLTPQFLRSFSFFDGPNEALYCVSYFGRLYKYNIEEDRFDLLAHNFPSDINGIEVIDGKIWVASENGVYRSQFNEDGSVGQPTMHFEIMSATCVAELPDKQVFVGTNSGSQYVLEQEAVDIIPLPFEIFDVNAAYVAKEGDIWVSSSGGLVLLQRNLFKPIISESPGTFVESMAEDLVNEIIYFTTILDLYAVELNNGIPGSAKNIMNVPRGYFGSLRHNELGLWASNRYQVFLINDNRITRKWDFAETGRFVFDLFIDSNDHVWLGQDGSFELKSIDPNFEIKTYPLPFVNSGNAVNAVHEDDKGILAGAVGEDQYLFHKAHGDSVFKNISLPIPFKIKTDLQVTDIAYNGEIIWLATSEGLLKYDYEAVQKVQVGNFNPEFAVRTIETLNDDELLFSNPLGIVRYKISTEEWWLYNEGNGLPSNNVVGRGILVDDNNLVFIGTSMGMAYAEVLSDQKMKTTMPWVSSAWVDGVQIPLNKSVSIPYGSYLNLAISPNIYPSNKVNLQYKFAQDSSAWKVIDSEELNLADLTAGDYSILLRSKKTGGYDWSEPREFSFLVNKPFWATGWFISLIAVAITTIIVVSVKLAQSLSAKRREDLEALVQEITDRNKAIEAQSKELTNANSELQLLNRQIGQQRQEISGQAKELKDNNEVIHKLNRTLQQEVDQQGLDLIKTNEELAKHNNELLQFSYTVSHNLRGPVARILGINNLMALSHNEKEKSEYLSLLNQITLDLDSVLTDLNLIIDTRNAIFKVRERILLNEEWDKCVSLLKDYIHEDFLIEVDFSDEPAVYSIRATVQNLFYNLLSNSLKYRSPDRLLNVRVKSFTENEFVAIKVSDNGLGIDMESHGGNVFKLYKRFHTHVAGKGLGLYLMKTQIELLKGKVELESQLNVGSTFTVFLPGPDNIDNQVIFENAGASLYFDALTNCVQVFWKNPELQQDFHEVLENLLELSKTYHSPGLVIDLNMHPMINNADDLAMVLVTLRETAANGLKRVALVRLLVRPDQGYHGIIEAELLKWNIDFKVFDDVESGKQWMQTIFHA